MTRQHPGRPASRVSAFVIPTKEELMIARHSSDCRLAEQRADRGALVRHGHVRGGSQSFTYR